MTITAVILTYNEELHIDRCIKSIYSIVDDIIVIDSFSTDSTHGIINNYDKVRFFQNKWTGKYADQFNYGLTKVVNKNGWVLRIDADEYLTTELIDEISKNIATWSNNYSAVSFSRRHVFINRWIKHGTYPTKLVRLFKYGIGYCEEKHMDEHIVISSGLVYHATNDFYDHNLNDFTWWMNKHIGYAKRELADYVEHDFSSKYEVGNQAQETRKLKNKYYNSPLFIRALGYFFYRYIIKLGFTQGKEGFVWYMFQCLFYRLYVDVLIFEVKIFAKKENISFLDAYEKMYKLKKI